MVKNSRVSWRQRKRVAETCTQQMDAAPTLAGLSVYLLWGREGKASGPWCQALVTFS